MNCETKSKKFKEGFKKTASKVGNFIYDNRDFIIPTLCGLALIVARCTVKKVNISRQALLHDRFCYDRKSGHYWELTRKLTNSEWLMINHMTKNGQYLGDVLNDLGVLK